MLIHRLFRRAALVLALAGVGLAGPLAARAQDAATIRLTGGFSVAYDGYQTLPLVVGLADATGYFGTDPIYLVPQADQSLGTYTGNAGNGDYTLTLPADPVGRPLDVMTGMIGMTGMTGPASESGAGAGRVRLFDVRLMSDVTSRGYMQENEDPIASSLRISVDSVIEGGTLIVWAADAAGQFPTGRGADGVLFTADDPRTPLSAGYSFVDLDSAPFQITTGATRALNLTTTGGGNVINLSRLSCADLIPTLLDRTQKYYPFTVLHQVDWEAIRAKLLPAAARATSQADCEALIRELGNALPDGHMNFSLPTVRDQLQGTVGMLLAPTSDGQIAVQFVRPGGPADQAGIKAGAVITTWDGKPIQQALDELLLLFSNASTPHALLDIQLTQLVRGTIGSTATIGYQNPGAAAASATLTRVGAVRANLPGDALNLRDGVLPSGIGYIRLPSFGGYRNMTDFDAELDALIRQKVPGLIIDIRGNGGGFSQISDAITSRFFDAGFIVGRAITADGRYVYQSRVEPRQPLYTGLVAVLVDENSVSAADLFAYTFKIGKRALIVGHTPTAGAAGTVSGGGYILPGSAFMQLPTGSFQDEAGQMIIEGTGVIPDLLVPRTAAEVASPRDEVLRAAEQALLDGQRP
jgi:carboxyl-terminal processing protease